MKTQQIKPKIVVTRDMTPDYEKARKQDIDWSLNVAANAERANKAQPQHSPSQFGMQDGRPTLKLDDNRSTEEKLRCAKIQIDSDRATITHLSNHADKLAEELRQVLKHGSAGNANLIRAALAAYEAQP